MKITHKEIFDEYTKTELKTGYIQKMAKKLNVPRSSVICELLKSGYKLDEIRRSDENNYKAGLNKYNKWKEEGEPEVTYEVPEVAPEVKEKKKYEKPVLRETEEMSKHPVPEELERAVNEYLSEKPEPVIVTEPEPVKEKPKSVAVSAAKGKFISENELDNAKLRLRIIDLEYELKQAKDKIRNMEDCSEKYNKLLTDFNVASCDAETNQNAMVMEYQRRIAVEAKLRKAERIICDRIYEDMPDEAE
ncbi:MAG: hypothetical protein J6P89_01510 [Oscillospiraceae bacterium]|nr:hypothetical protein [Oscillospiraceae bacterium]